jgi:hypothetical protein
MISGHCATPQTDNPEESHERCHKNGGGNRANPFRQFSPCPCPCHYPEERYECGNCGGMLAEAPLWPQTDGTDDPVYTHMDAKTGRAIGEECGGTVSRNTDPEPEAVEEVEDDEPEEDEECPNCFARRGSPACLAVCGDGSAFDEDEDDFADLMEDFDE